MKRTHLENMIRKVVAEEVRKQLPNVVSEMYLKKLVSEASVRETHWEDTFDAELQRRTEEIPEMMHNSDEGIYQRGGPIKRKNEEVRQQNEQVVSKLLSPGNSMAHLYESVEPIGRQSASAPGMPAPQTDVPLEALGIKRYNLADYNVTNSGPMQQTDEAEERRLELHRASLDRKA